MDVAALLDQQAGDIDGFVGGDGAGDAEDDGLVALIVAGSIGR